MSELRTRANAFLEGEALTFEEANDLWNQLTNCTKSLRDSFEFVILAMQS
jgi:hypothetical protein